MTSTPRSRTSSSPSPSCSTSSSAHPPSAARGCSISWSCSSASWWSGVAQTAAADEIDAAPAAQQNGERREPQAPRRKPARRPLPENLPRERRVEPSPSACPCCGGRLRKLGEDITEMLERVPAQWKVIQHVREKLTCRTCEVDHAAAGTVASDRTWTRGAAAARRSPVRQVRRAPAAQPAERHLRARGRRSRCVDAGRLGRRVGRDADAAARRNRGARARYR